MKIFYFNITFSNVCKTFLSISVTIITFLFKISAMLMLLIQDGILNKKKKWSVIKEDMETK